MTAATLTGPQEPTLLYNDECAVCRTIAAWVRRSGTNGRMIVRPIGDDPAILRALNPELDIWAAYATIHMLMPNGTMRTGGEAVAEVFRNLPNCRWFAGVFDARALGIRPFQLLLNIGYTLLADVRPLFGCESCGTSNPAIKALHAASKSVRARFGQALHPSAHFSARPAVRRD